jgi:hypothetical protein
VWRERFEEDGCGGGEEAVERNEVGGGGMGWRVAGEERKGACPAEVSNHAVTAAASGAEKGQRRAAAEGKN